MNGNLYRVSINGACTPAVTSDPDTLIVNARPAITLDPVDATICAGANTGFTITATGSDLVYAWQVDKGSGFGNISDVGVYSGSATNTLTITAPDASYNTYKYKVVVSGTCSPPASSGPGILTVNVAPSIVTQPAASTICEFNNTNFSAVAGGAGLTYRWQENRGSGWNDLSNSGNYIGADLPTLSIYNIARTMNGYQYRLVVNGTCTPAATSAVAGLVVNTAPEILSQPSDSSVCETVTAKFMISARGTALTYVWQEDQGSGFVDLTEAGEYSGTATNLLSVANPLFNKNGFKYRVKIAGTCAPPVTSDFGILTVNQLPVVTSDPSDAVMCEEGNVTFFASATGTNISYQWAFNDGSGWVNVSDTGIYSGAKTTALTITSAVTDIDGYQYRMNLIGSCGSIPSDAATIEVNALPTVNITGDGMYPMVCGGLDLNLNGNPLGGSGTYASHIWTGDIVALDRSNTQTPVFNTLASGTFNLTYTLTDNKGCKAAESIVVTVERPMAAYISDATPSCGTITVSYTNQTTNAVSYKWDFNDPNDPAFSTETDPVHDFENFTPQVYYYTVVLTAESTNGCLDNTSQVVTVYPSIYATFSLDKTEECTPVTAQMTAIVGGKQYYWDFGDGNQEIGGAVITHDFTNTSGFDKTYVVELTTTSFYGCTDTQKDSILVHPIPAVMFSADPVYQQFPESRVDFTNLTPAGSWTYLWDFKDGTTSTEENPTHTYAGPGEYDVTLTAVTANCSESDITKVTVTPAAPIADFTPPAAGCGPLTIQFENNSQYATSYLWDFGGISESYKENPTFTFYEAGNFAVKLIVHGPGGTDNQTYIVSVKETPNAYIDVRPAFVFVNDAPVKGFNFSSDTVNPSYLWDFGDGTTYDALEPTHVYTEPGRYDVTLTITNDNACKDSYTFSYIEVEPAGELIFPNVFRPNPNNPSGGEYRPGQDNNEIFFPGVFDQVIEYELTIYNRWGERIFISKKVSIGWDGYVNGKLAEQGVYIWQVRGKYANGKTFNRNGDITLLR